MNWTTIGDVLFLAGGFVSGCLVLYGGWLCITESIQQMFEAKGEAEPPVMRPVGGEPKIAALKASLTMSVLMVVVSLQGEAFATEPFELGLKAYHQTKYNEAVSHFRSAAEGGNGRAQEILGFMYLHGAGSYGPSVPHDRNEATYWFGRAAKDGREVSQHMLCVLSGRPANTVVDRASCGASTASTAVGFRP